MTSSLPSCGMYIIGVTYSRPLLRPRWCTKTIGAPSKVPPTLPSFARNSAMVFAFQSSGSFMSNSCRSRSRGMRRERVMEGLGPQDDLAVGVAAFELGVGRADLRQRVDVRD